MFLHWGHNTDPLHEVEIQTEEELRFACKMIAEECYRKYQKFRGDFDEIEKEVELRANEQCSDEEIVNSDDDITQEDFYMMGYRHEIT